MLPVVHFAVVIACDSVEPGVQTAESLIPFLQDIIAEAIGTAKVIFCAGIMNGRVLIVVNVHPGLPLHPAGVVSVHA